MMMSEWLLSVIAVTTVSLSLCVVCVTSDNEARVAATGSCGKNCDWDYDSYTSIFRISGTGEMDNCTNCPWLDYAKFADAVVFDGDIESIGEHAFDSCQFSSITIPSSVTSIFSSAFRGCTKLSSVTIPATVRYISHVYVFSDCTNLTSINVSESNPNYKDIDGVLFNKLGSTLVAYPPGRHGSYVIPNTVQSIGYAAFWYCPFLTSVTIPNSVTSIDGYAFSGCISLTHVTIPESVSFISNRPFGGCSNLTSIDVDKNSKYYKSVDGVLFTKDGSVLHQYPNAKKGSYSIPDGVKSISIDAFGESIELTSLVIPSSVTLIATQAFFGCPKLEVVSYLGTSNPADREGFGFFTGSFHVVVVCVPPQYSLSEPVFCERTDLWYREKCEDFRYNYCYSASCNNGEWQMSKRTEAIKWEEKSNGCVSYLCDNDTGFVGKSLCTEPPGSVCVDNQCSIDTPKAWRVDITFDVDEVIELDNAEIVEALCDLTGMKSDQFVVGVVFDDDGLLLRVVVYLDDEKSALTVKESLDEIDIESGCSYGILCRRDETTIFSNQWISVGNRWYQLSILYVIMLSLFAMLFV